jgi:hypothetical protein
MPLSLLLKVLLLLVQDLLQMQIMRMLAVLIHKYMQELRSVTVTLLLLKVQDIAVQVLVQEYI